MTPSNPFDLLLPNKGLSKLLRSNKQARKALAKMNRKLAQARKAKDLTEIRLLLGMAQVALSKAEFLARTQGATKCKSL